MNVFQLAADSIPWPEHFNFENRFDSEHEWPEHTEETFLKHYLHAKENELAERNERLRLYEEQIAQNNETLHKKNREYLQKMEIEMAQRQQALAKRNKEYAERFKKERLNEERELEQRALERSKRNREYAEQFKRERENRAQEMKERARERSERMKRERNEFRQQREELRLENELLKKQQRAEARAFRDANRQKQLAWMEQMHVRENNLSKGIAEALLADGLIDDTQNFTFSLSQKRLKVNGQKQSQEMTQKYLELYEGLTGKELNKKSNVNINMSLN